MTTSHHEPSSFAAKLNHLFASVRAPDATREYTNEQVADAICESGVKISTTYVWQLRTGRRDNPTIKHLEALAGFFGVPSAYFLNDDVTRHVDQRLDELHEAHERLLAATSRDEIKMMAARAGELSPEGLSQVAELVNVVYELERLKRGDAAKE